MSKAKTKVLAWSDGPTTTTGFGRVAREVLKSVYDTGEYDITSIGINYFGITPEKPAEGVTGSDRDIFDAYKNYKLIPAGIGKDGDPFGRSILLESLATGEYDVLWILQDTFNVVGLAQQILKLKQEHKFKIIFYFPIDARDIHKSYVEATQIADQVVTYNEWTKDLFHEMAPGQFEGRLKTIYHGYNPKDFFKISDSDKSEFRKYLFEGRVEEDDILIVRSDSNQQRKDWLKTIQIVAEVAKGNPKVKLYANTTMDNKDFPIFDMAMRHGLQPNVNFFYQGSFTKTRNLPQEELNKLYNIADIGISTARGEGCGLFHYEMMALGTPLLISNNSAHIEAVSEGAAWGIDCGVQDDGSINMDFTTILPNDLGVMRPVCSVSDGVKKLTEMIALSKSQRDEIGKEGIEFMKHLHWSKLGRKWAALFKKVVESKDIYMHGEETTKELPKEEQTQANEALQEFATMVQNNVENAKKEFRNKYNAEPPEINYIGKEDKPNDEKEKLITP